MTQYKLKSSELGSEDGEDILLELVDSIIWKVIVGASSIDGLTCYFNSSYFFAMSVDVWMEFVIWLEPWDLI